MVDDGRIQMDGCGDSFRFFCSHSFFFSKLIMSYQIFCCLDIFFEKVIHVNYCGFVVIVYIV